MTGALLIDLGNLKAFTHHTVKETFSPPCTTDRVSAYNQPNNCVQLTE